MAIVGASGMREIEDEGHAVLGVIFGAEVALLEGAIGTCALAWIVDPAHQIIVIVFFAHATEIRGERAAHDVGAFTNGMAAEAAAGLEEFLAVHGVTGSLLGQSRSGECRLPDEGGYGLHFVGLQ